jgi:hypothetical protein
MLQYDMTTQDLTIDWDDFKAVFKTPDPEPDMTFADDPVALAWAAYRVYLSNPALRWADFADVEVTVHDRAVAQEIRSYYTGRILMDTMKSKNPMSEFRKKLYGLLIGETGLKKKDIGLLYRLPYFYVEDTALDQVIAQTEAPKAALAQATIAGTFTIIKRIQVSRRSMEFVQFWLQHHKKTEPFMIAVKADNPLLPLLQNILERGLPISATAHFKIHRGYHRNRGFYQLSNVELAS